MVSKNNVAQRKTTQQRISQALLGQFDNGIELELETPTFEDGGGIDDSRARSQTFVFVREVKGLVGEYLDASEGLAIMTKILQMRLPEADDPWAATLPEHSDPASDFYRMWNLVQFPVGMLDRAVASAKGRPVPIVSGISAKYDLFLAVCAALQQLRGEGREFFLTQTVVAAALGVEQPTVSNYVARAKESRFLRETQPAVTKRRSAYFLFSLQIDTKITKICKTSTASVNSSEFKEYKGTRAAQNHSSKRDCDFEREENKQRNRDCSRFDEELDAIAASVGVDRKGRREQWQRAGWPDGPEAA